ncbi:MAG: RagB/SusD family nutrient uptake outer membrane protein [Saprospiraceae bacterium]
MKRKYIFLPIILLCLLNCTKELEQTPISNATTLTFYQSTNDFNQGLNAVYSSLRGYPDRILNLSETRSDNVYGVSDGGVRDWEGVNSFHNTLASNPYIAEAWSANYSGIFRANNYLEQLQKNGSVITDAALKTRFEAEARFLRAFMYFDLVRTFGKVPLIDKVVSQNEALAISRSSTTEVYSLIIADLQFAAQNLSASYTATNAGRITNFAAKGLLALVYMTRSGATYNIDGPGTASNEWNTALGLLNDIINSNKFSLQPTYPDVFSYTKEGNPEVIMDIQFISGGLGLGSGFPIALVPDPYLTSKGLPQGGSIRPISNDLVNSYEAADTRKAFTIFLNGFTSNGVLDDRPFYIKYLDVTKKGNDRLDWPVNFIVLRYADILLLKAECILQGATGGGTAADALALVNQVRKRAGLPDATSITLAGLFTERRKEFAAEGTRWYDLVRSGQVDKIINAWIPVEDVMKQMRPFNTNFIIYPIPQSEMDVKQGLYTQNAGY